MRLLHDRRVVALFLLLIGASSCSETVGEPGGASSLRAGLAFPPDAAHDVTAVLFEVTGTGGTQSQIVPLHPEPLPDSVSPSLAGHRFADWFVVLNPGDYDVTVTPLRGTDPPERSEQCAPASGVATVLAGLTTELILVSQCGEDSGALDVVVVLNSNPFLEELLIEPNKFICDDEEAVLTAIASDPDGDLITYEWDVVSAPPGATAADYSLAVNPMLPYVATFSATVPGIYELVIRLSDGNGGMSSLIFPIIVSDCDGDPDPGSLHGRKWVDTNGNGERDPDEPGLPGVTIYLDSNLNNQLDEGEPRTVTMEDDPNTDFDEAGLYWLEGVPPGLHVVREVVPDGFEQTFPGSIGPPENADGVVVDPEVIALNLGNGESVVVQVSWSFLPFCIRPIDVDVIAPGAPMGLVQNETGVLVNGCGGDTSTFDIRFTGDGSPHAFDLQFIDAGFGGVLGTIRVSIGFDGAHVVFLNPGDRIEGLDFGNQPILPGSVHGRKWLDRNGNGERDDNEPGLPGVIIYSDLNFNGELDEGEPRTITMQDDPNTDFDEAGLYWLEGLPAGRHVIREVVPDGFVQTFPTLGGATDDDFLVIDPTSISLDLANGESVVVQVSWTFLPLCVRPFDVDVVAPGTPTGLVANETGVLVNGCGGDTSTFDIRFTGDGLPHAFELLFVDAEFGGVLGTIPVGINTSLDGAHVVLLGPGDNVEGLDFGNQPTNNGSIHGRKWLDENGNAQRDDNEPGLPGVTIYLDLNNNGVLDDNEPRTVTMRDDPNTDFDESGLYWLVGLPAGQYTVREVVPDGFVQTFPIDGAHQLMLVTGSIIDGIDFGNLRQPNG